MSTTPTSPGPRPALTGPAPKGGRKPERIEELLAELNAYWHADPDLRLGQIISNFTTALSECTNHPITVRGIEDDALLGMLQTGLRDPRDAARELLHPTTPPPTWRTTD